ncbi:Tri11 [Stachybotrys chartarum IBT 7711]|uniref:Tri11 n=1 Tax=Stachybotrys chartarum (strain CBS 109288 / IBT 7711) TaxID=1280523 RepID=A0A084AFG3_STACB|nr:Tri11 [Stachybotrys chartarum IBT 7711]KFA45334.1 Tri11 [Stachybotrys chartarum IBT 40293]
MTVLLQAAALAAAAYTLSIPIQSIYNLYFHPLSKIPGPKLWIAFPILGQIARVRGVLDSYMCAFHRVYGEAVRYGPDEVSIITEQAWKDIYNHRPNQLERNILSTTRRPDIFDAVEVDHDRYRKAMSHAFSPKGLQEQEPIVKGYLDLLIERLNQVAANEGKTDMVQWYNFMLFDTIGDLAFGQSFGGLRDQVLHFSISFTFEAFKLLTYMEAGARYPLLLKVLELFTPKSIIEARDRKEEHAEATVKQRLENGSMHGRGDFMDAMLRNRGKPGGLNDRELIANASTLITAGSETTATILSGMTYWLLRNPDNYKKVVHEVRSAYSSDSEILMITTTTRLPFMIACFQEAFRLYPPVPSCLQRVTPETGMTQISGYDIPPNTKVGVHALAAYTDPRNWHRPDEFLPERWLPEVEKNPASPFYKDRRATLQPFSVGPRSCIGRNMAEQEMRLILARLLWNFDLALCPESKDWKEQKTHYLWEKHPLMCSVRRRVF